MEFNIGEEDYFHYPDAREYPMSRFYERLKNGETAKTSQINRLVYCSTFEEALKAGKGRPLSGIFLRPERFLFQRDGCCPGTQ